MKVLRWVGWALMVAGIIAIVLGFAGVGFLLDRLIFTGAIITVTGVQIAYWKEINTWSLRNLKKRLDDLDK